MTADWKVNMYGEEAADILEACNGGKKHHRRHSKHRRHSRQIHHPQDSWMDAMYGHKAAKVLQRCHKPKNRVMFSEPVPQADTAALPLIESSSESEDECPQWMVDMYGEKAASVLCGACTDKDSFVRRARSLIISSSSSSDSEDECPEWMINLYGEKAANVLCEEGHHQFDDNAIISLN